MYTVVHHMPGYLPESDPWEFEDYSDAVHCLIEDIERYYDDSDLSLAQRMGIEVVLDDAREALTLDHPIPLGYTLSAYGCDTHFAINLT